MTKDDIMKLARKAGLFTHKDVQPEILAFANLVAAAVRTDDMYKYRIHPADAHLGYGPISTALREMAINDLWPSKCWKCAIASSAANEFTVYFDSRTGEPDYPLFYLFLAEFLADEGM